MSTHYPRPRSRYFQSRVTNGGELLPGIDGRSRWARRLHDLIANHVSDMGGPKAVSQAQFMLIKSAANLIIMMEKWEVTFAQDDGASLPGLMAYQTTANSLRRIYETLGLNRAESERGEGMEVDPKKLNPIELRRFGILMHQYNTFGLQGMGLEHAQELRALLLKGRADTNRVREIAHAKR